MTNVSPVSIKSIQILAKNKWLQKHIKRASTDSSYATNSILAGTILKDNVGRAVFAVQTMNNDDIPKENKTYIATLDLMTGLLTAASMFVTSVTVSNDKFHTKITKLILPKENTNSKNFLNFKNGFKFFSTLFIAAIVVRRVVVTYLATPLSSAFKRKFLEKENNNPFKDKQNLKLPDKKSFFSTDINLAKNFT